MRAVRTIRLSGIIVQQGRNFVPSFTLSDRLNNTCWVPGFYQNGSCRAHMVAACVGIKGPAREMARRITRVHL